MSDGVFFNGVMLLSFIFLIMLIKFIAWTFQVHKSNIKMQQKLGKQAFEWLLNDGQKFIPIKTMKFDIDGILKEMSKKNNFNANRVTDAFTELGKSFINIQPNFKKLSHSLMLFKEIKDEQI